MRRTGVILALLATLSAGCGGDADEEQDRRTAEGCRRVEKPKAKDMPLPEPKRKLAASKRITAIVETSCGDFEIALDTRRSPRTTNSFAYLAERDFYDGTTFHRIVPDQLIQGGDPKGNSRGGPGYTLQEPPPPNQEYPNGLVAMAKTEAQQPGSSGSQFFIVTAPGALDIDPAYAVLGRVSKGMTVVDRIGRLGHPSGTGKPSQPVVIERIRLREG